MTDKMPLVSIVTPSLNQAQFLEETIQSVLNQDYPNIEHIIIDGGSTDGSLEIIRRYEDHLAYWVSERDEGSSDAINKGWRHSKGNYLWILNSDDLLVTPDAISVLVHYLEDHPQVAFAYGDMYYMDKGGQVIGHKQFPDYTLVELVLKEKRYPFPGCLMRSYVLNTVGNFDNNLEYVNDLDYFIRLLLHHKMGHVDRFTGYFRVHSQGNTQAHLFWHGNEIIQVYEKLLASPKAPPEIRQHSKKIWGVAHYKAAYCYARSGYAKQARTHILKAIQYKYTYVLNIRPWVILALSLLGNAGMGYVMSRLVRAFPPGYKYSSSY